MTWGSASVCVKTTSTPQVSPNSRASFTRYVAGVEHHRYIRGCCVGAQQLGQLQSVHHRIIRSVMIRSGQLRRAMARPRCHRPASNHGYGWRNEQGRKKFAVDRAIVNNQNCAHCHLTRAPDKPGYHRSMLLLFGATPILLPGCPVKIAGFKPRMNRHESPRFVMFRATYSRSNASLHVL